MISEASLLTIVNVHLPADSDEGRASRDLTYDIVCQAGKIERISPRNSKDVKTAGYGSTIIDAEGGIVIPSLCHAHIHLDKCYLLDERHNILTGTFEEALKVTSEAKATFSVDDVVTRGDKLIRQSVVYGVTSMRAHVEVDRVVNMKCLEAGIILRERYQKRCDIQIAGKYYAIIMYMKCNLCLPTVFAQDPLWPAGEEGQSDPLGLQLLCRACMNHSVEAIGSAPYVESSIALAKRNVDAVIELALKFDKHLDFHLDYNIDPNSAPLIFYVISKLHKLNWPSLTDKVVTIGHATRLSMFSHEDLVRLKREIGDLPLHFVGLPQSDVYIMGREQSSTSRPRGTIQVPRLRKEYDLNVSMAVNNVGNAFTPQGCADPLSLCPFGVAVYQMATSQECHILLESVTTFARRSIGLGTVESLRLKVGDPADLLVLPGLDQAGVEKVVLCPSQRRVTIKGGEHIATRELEERMEITS